MKYVFSVCFFLLNLIYIQAQNSNVAFNGKGDQKLQIGTTFQNRATGISSSYDIGITHNLSVGIFGSYMLSVSDAIENHPNKDFLDVFDLRARLNANIGNVINVDNNLDVYPGLHLGLRNFGGHLGVRYFLSPTFGVYVEGSIPFASYEKDTETILDEINNQFTCNLGACFHF